MYLPLNYIQVLQVENMISNLFRKDKKGENNEIMLYI